LVRKKFGLQLESHFPTPLVEQPPKQFWSQAVDKNTKYQRVMRIHAALDCLIKCIW